MKSKKAISLFILLTLVSCSHDIQLSDSNYTSKNVSYNITEGSSDLENTFDSPSLFQEARNGRTSYSYLTDIDSVKAFALLDIVKTEAGNIFIMNPQYLSYKEKQDHIVFYNIDSDGSFSDVAIIENYCLYIDEFGYYYSDPSSYGDGGHNCTLEITCLFYPCKGSNSYELIYKQDSGTSYCEEILNGSDVVGKIYMSRMSKEKIEYMQGYIKDNLIYVAK